MSSQPPDHRPLVERVRPSSLKRIVGNARAINDLEKWGQGWDRGRTPPRARAAILEGPPGVGKTTAALALAADLGWTVVELNASDARNQRAIDLVAGRAAISHTLDAQGKSPAYSSGARTLILLDEADALSGRVTDSAPARKTTVTFRDFVRTRYGTLDALAKAWGLGVPEAPPPFRSWEQVPAAGGRGAWSRRPAAQRDLGEWRGARAPPDHSDRGGLPAILRLIPATRQPIVLTLNDWSPYARAGAAFLQSVARVRFGPVPRPDIETVLRQTIAQERLVIARDALDAILDRSQGDLRAALNDLDAIAPLPPGPQQREVLTTRDQPADFFAITDEVLRHPRYYRSAEIMARLDATPDDLLPWVEEGVPRVAATLGALAAGLTEVAHAERFLALARRHRVWALWSFASELMTGGAGLAMASISTPAASSPLAFPQFLSSMGRTRWTRATRTAVLGKVGRQVHLSRRKGTEEMLPWMEAIFRRGTSSGTARNRYKLLRDRLETELALSPEEIDYLLAAPEPTARPRPPAKESPRPAATGQEAAAATPSAKSSSPPPVAQSRDEGSPPAKGSQRRLGEY